MTMNRYQVTTQYTVTQTYEVTAQDSATADANYASGSLTATATTSPVIQSTVLQGQAPATPIYDFGDYRDTRGRTPVSASIFTQAGSAIIGVSGQSIVGNFSLLSGYQPFGEIYELNVWDGNIYRVDQNLIMGSNGGVAAWAGRTSFLPYLAQQLLAAGKAQRVLLCCAIMGGTNAFEWSPAAPAAPNGSRLGSRRTVIIEQLGILGLTCKHWIHDQGPSDSDPSKTNNAISGKSWADLTQWGFTNDLRNAGYTGAIQVPLDSLAPWGNATFARQGQAMLLTNATAGPYVIGPDCDQWNQTRVDGVHFGNNERYYAVNSGYVPILPNFP